LNPAAQEYLAARVLTASPRALHLLVVDGALRHMARAEELLETGDRSAAHASLNDARAFVGELLLGVNADEADPVAANVASLFTFAYRRLVEAEIHGSADKVREAARVLRVHRETWSELLKQLSGGAPTAVAPVIAIPTRPATASMPAEYDDYQPRSWSG
jgi:flagellar protein FliS